MKSIRSQLLLNYVVISFLALLLVLTVTLINRMYNNAEDDFFSIDMEQLSDDYLNHELEYAFNSQAFTEYDSIEILNSDYTVVETINGRNEIGYIYGKQELNELISLSEDYTYFTWYIEDTDGLFMFVQLEPLGTFYDILIIFSLIAIILFLAVVYLFARHTGSQIVKPINKLREGAKALEEGNLNYRIYFDGNNELVELRDAFNSMSAKLSEEIKKREHMEENRKILIRNISHDIKTPLTNIIGYSQTLLSGENLSDEDIYNAKKTILKNGLSADCLVSELFDLSKLDSDANIIDKKDQDIVELFRLKVIDYIPEFEIMHIDFTIDIPDKRIILPISTVEFDRALDNLIQNSIKYNVGNFAMDFSLIEETDSVVLTISDNGIGIPPEYTEKIFEPTIRVDASRLTEGSGLGLAITKKIIEIHNGEIWLDQTYENGCCFVIRMPK